MNDVINNKVFYFSNSSISQQYNILSRIYVRQRRPFLIQRLVTRGILFSKKKMRKYRRLALASLITKRFIFQQFYYSFLTRLLRWFRHKIVHEKYGNYYKCKCFSLNLLRAFLYFSIVEQRERVFKFIAGIPTTVLRRRHKKLLFHKVYSLAKPIMIRYGRGRLRGLGLYFKGYSPTGSWIVNFFKRSKYRYKISTLSLFSGYRGRTFFYIRRHRKKKKRGLTWKRRKYIEKFVKFSKVNKVEYLKRNINVMPSYEIRAEVYLKYFYEYTLNDLHQISHRFFKIFPYCSLGLIFHFLNKRLDFLVRRQFCNLRITVVRDILKKGLVCVNGICVRDPSYIVKTGQLISLKLFVRDMYSSYIVSLFMSMFSIRNNILRKTFKMRIYKILLFYLRYKLVELKGLRIPVFSEIKYDQRRFAILRRIDSLRKRLLEYRSRSGCKSKFLKMGKIGNNFLRRKDRKVNVVMEVGERDKSRKKRKITFPKSLNFHMTQKRFYSYSHDRKRSGRGFGFRRNTNRIDFFGVRRNELKNKGKGILNRNRYTNRDSYRYKYHKDSKFKFLDVRNLRGKHNKQKRRKRWLLRYRDIDMCKVRCSLKDRIRRFIRSKKFVFDKSRFYVDVQKNKDQYIYRVAIRYTRKIRKYKFGWRQLLGIYNVYHWEIDYNDNVRLYRRRLLIHLIKSLKKVNEVLLNVIISMCRRQRYFLNNIHLLILSYNRLKECNSLIRDIFPVHRRYLGIIYKYYSRSGKLVSKERRIKSLALKLFIKLLEKDNVNILDSSYVKKNELYNTIINASPTKFHKLVKVSNYLLLLRYRTVLPYYYEHSVYFNFECLRVSPLTYIRRGCILYENRPGSNKVTLRKLSV